ncbi:MULTISPECIES: glycine betaine ABC transporter substrate-binding protein [unclassified Roseobacter]|uniref:ABC transporter substrate-binding protein n=1 Tax=unclassified Roseobacter TaxID=196798 RepID=UPI0018A3292F|nr:MULTISPECIES: glycine betaine ABC transporter substrate-binding protein [unclassified Roseobacter]MDW3183399.1 glycine betaine ABC transporter substrate-binding protein [Roseobacter sp.]
MKGLKHSAAASALLLAATGAGAQEKITFSDLSWNGAQAIGHVLAAIVEQEMGGDAEIVSGMNQAAVIMAGMDKGDGSIDVYTDMWMPNQQALWDEYIDGNQTVATNKPYKGTSNIYVPSYMADKVSSIEDLNNPEIAAMFDTDGNGKGEYWAGDVTWASTKRWQIKFKSYGLDGLWEPNIVSADTFKAGLEAAYTAGKPQLFYYWTPEAIHVKYDLTALEEPDRFDGCEVVDLDAEDWLEVSYFECVIAANDIFVAYSKSLEERNPPVAKMLSNVQFTGDEINGWIVEMFENKRDPREVAEDWIADNKETVTGWING